MYSLQQETDVEKGREHGNIVPRKNFGLQDLQKIFGGTNLGSKKEKNRERKERKTEEKNKKDHHSIKKSYF